MKSFLEFCEQAEQAAKLALASKQRSAQYTKSQLAAGMKHRTHVHRELAQRASSEKKGLW